VNDCEGERNDAEGDGDKANQQCCAHPDCHCFLPPDGGATYCGGACTNR
jgi:hypothetical protein